MSFGASVFLPLGLLDRQLPVGSDHQLPVGGEGPLKDCFTETDFSYLIPVNLLV